MKTGNWPWCLPLEVDVTAHRCLSSFGNIQMTRQTCRLPRQPRREAKAYRLPPLVQVEAVKAPSGCFMMMSKEGGFWPSRVAWVIESALPPAV